MTREDEIRERRQRYMRFQYDTVYCGEDMLNLVQVLEDSYQENQRLLDEFNSYRETAEEIHQCYINCHQDSWKFEEALRRIANKSLDDGQNVGVADGHEQRKIALEVLETAWKRREERASQALQPKEASE